MAGKFKPGDQVRVPEKPKGEGVRALLYLAIRALLDNTYSLRPCNLLRIALAKLSRRTLFPRSAFIWRALYEALGRAPFPRPQPGPDVCDPLRGIGDIRCLLLVPRRHHHGVHEGVLPPVEAIMAACVLIAASAPREVHPWGDDPPKDGGLSASILFTADVTSGFRRIAHSLLPSPPSPSVSPAEPVHARSTPSRRVHVPTVSLAYFSYSLESVT